MLALWQAPAGARKLNRLRDITASLNISERSAFGIITDLAQTGYVVKEKDGPRCTWPRSWRPGCAILAGTRLARMSCRCWQTAQRRLAPPTTPAWPG